MFPEVNIVFEYFLKNPTTTIHIRELARKTAITPSGCLKALSKLLERGFVEKQKTKALVNYKAKLTPKFIIIKKIYNIYSLFDSGLVDYLKQQYESPDAIIAFGSFARGEDTEQSDIDIVIMTRFERSINLSKYEKILDRKINTLELSDIKTAKKEFINGLINGVILDGVLKI